MSLYDSELRRLTGRNRVDLPRWIVALVLLGLIALIVGMWHNQEISELIQASWRA